MPTSPATRSSALAAINFDTASQLNPALQLLSLNQGTATYRLEQPLAAGQCVKVNTIPPGGIISIGLLTRYTVRVNGVQSTMGITYDNQLGGQVFYACV